MICILIDKYFVLIAEIIPISEKICLFIQNNNSIKMLRFSTDFIHFSLTMAYGIGRNIALLF